MLFYGKYEALMEYERSTLGIMIKKDQEYMSLLDLSSDPIYRGLKSWELTNLLHNFSVLDKILKSM